MISISENLSGLIKIIALFPGGRSIESKKCLAQSLASMFKKSTTTLPGKKLQEKIDYYGMSLDIYATSFYTVFELSGLSRYATDMIHLLHQIIYQAEFKEADWKISKNTLIENIKQSQFQSDYWADKLLSINLIGSDHFAGYYSEIEDYNLVTCSDISQYYRNFFLKFTATWFLAGDQVNLAKEAIEKLFPSPSHTPKRPIALSSVQPLTIEKRLPGAAQASIRLGMLLPRKSFKEFMDMEVLSTYLGGYYLSELMKVLRIELGMTYGVYSHLTHYADSSIYTIAYETDERFIGPSLDAIKNLFARLKSERKIDFQDAKSQYLSSWTKQSEQALNEILFEVKMHKLGYSYKSYKTAIKRLKSNDSFVSDKLKTRFFNFDNYTKVIVY